MTDIWRSLIAQRICWENGWFVLFHRATVYQERNAHDLMKDFAEEIPGYLQTENIQKVLSKIKIKKGLKNIPDAMRVSYEYLIKAGIFATQEMGILESWLKDIGHVTK